MTYFFFYFMLISQKLQKNNIQSTLLKIILALHQHFCKHVLWPLCFENHVISKNYQNLRWITNLLSLVNCRMSLRRTRGEWLSWNNCPLSSSRSAKNHAKTLSKSRPLQGQVIPPSHPHPKKKKNRKQWPPDCSRFTNSFSISFHLNKIWPWPRFSQRPKSMFHLATK